MIEISDVLKHSLMITAFVLIIMLLIEYVNVSTRGTFNKALKQKGWVQILLATVLGLVPGCMGAFTVVSLYTHNILSLGALVAALISASGDEAFFMFSMIPETAIKLNIVLIIIAIVAGFIVDYIIKKKPDLRRYESHLQIHDHEPQRIIFSLSSIKDHFRSISFQRALLLMGIVLFIVGLASGALDDSHLHASHGAHSCETDNHLLHNEGFWGFQPSAVNIVFLIVSILSLVLITVVPDHFLEHHLWEHIIKKHFLKVFLWTAGALALTSVILYYVDFSTWIRDNLWIILLVSVLVGIIPESGPHMIFISLFMSGSIPFSILLANSIVQDGHGALPLLAESKRSFILVKAINVMVGFAAGALGLLVGY